MRNVRDLSESWVPERLREIGFPDIAAKLRGMTQPSRDGPRKLTEEQKAAARQAARRRAKRKVA